MTASEIRRSFLTYFERHGHRIVPSARLVPHDDPTLLFTNAGMNQFKDVFLGREQREYQRATTAQKCMRVSGKHNDLENVGPSFTHHTFFEMLGNFSFGDYFKKDAIPFAWTLLTDEWNLPADRLFATVFKGEGAVPRDTEAYSIWATFLPSDRIGALGAADNFWQMGETGPCGRCSEIYYYRGPQIPCGQEAHGQTCRGLECSCDRYIEIWNNVFMEFDRQADGTLTSLPAPSIDTGMGLERVTAVLQGHLSNYDTDLFTPLLAAIGDRAGATHTSSMSPTDVSMRVVADHIRAITFLIADGVVPSSDGRGYVLRKIMRRAIRHKLRLGVNEPMLGALVDVVVHEYGNAYPELSTGRGVILHYVQLEESAFEAVLTVALPKLEEVLDRAAATDGVVHGDAAFRLYETHGLPLEFIEDMAEERTLRFDKEGFDRAMEGQRDKARARSAFKLSELSLTWSGGDNLEKDIYDVHERFEGYDTLRMSSRVLFLLQLVEKPDALYITKVEQLNEGDEGYAVMDRTPFYVQAGGQVSDQGQITSASGTATVSGVEARLRGGPRFHKLHVNKGTIAPGDVEAVVDIAFRHSVRRNHTATHLLHAALRQVLGPHVNQAGSLVAPDRLRFDFVHFGPVTHEQQLEIERIVNEQIVRNTPVETEVTNTQEAIAAGAMALFGEKYGNRVRVVSVPGFSVELCGGTHVRATGDIGLFAIVSEGGVAAGTRRLEAVTGLEALRLFQRNRDQIAQLAETLNARPDELVVRISGLQEETRRLTRELQQARMKAAMGGGGAAAIDDTVDIGGVKLVAREVTGLDKDALRTLVDQQRDRIKSGVVILAAPADGKVTVVVGVTPDLATKLPAGQVVKELAPIVGGRGGGRPDFAEAGGKDLTRIADMLAASRAVIEKILAEKR